METQSQITKKRPMLSIRIASIAVASIHISCKSAMSLTLTTPPPSFPDPYTAIQWWARVAPAQEAVVFPNAQKRITYSELLHQCSALAAGLKGLGVKPGDAVAIWAENRAEWIVSQLAICAAGAVMVPVNTHFREQDVAYVLRHSKAVAILLSERFRKNGYLDMVQSQRAELPALRHVVCFDSRPGNHPDDVVNYADLMQTPTDTFDATPPAARAIASVQYTSGTTGRPKGAALCWEGMSLNAQGTADRLRVQASDRWTSIIPLFHCAGCIMNVTTALLRGATYVGVPAFDPVEMMAIVQAERCTLLTGVPTSYLAMLDHPRRGEFDMQSLRAGTCGGADCDPGVLERCAQEFPIPGLVQVYGQTESSTLIALDDVASPERWHSAGLPLQGMDVRVTHPETRTPLPTGSVGQIEVRGPMVMLGYFELPDETAKTISEDGWMQTGDLGYLRPDDRVVIAGGRLRDMIIRGGENIYPVEIENLLRQHPAVAEIAVFGVPDRYYGEVVVAAVQLNAPASSDQLRQFCHGKIAGFKHPVRFYSVAQWPMTSSGKIKKRELQASEADGQLQELA
jgi:fatty-acyl-CoA synthase